MDEQRRYPELGCSVIQHAIRHSRLKTPEAVTDEAMRIVDARERQATRTLTEALKGDALALAIILVCLAILWAIGG